MECDVCGNDYDKPLHIEYQGSEHTFDCFECAISALAPACKWCDVRIIGHGMEAGGEMFCCASCAERAGYGQMRDRV